MFNNPIIFLFKKLWEYSSNRSRVIAYILLSVCAGIISLIQPIVFGSILNIIQQEGLRNETMGHILWLLLLLVLIDVGFWAFHGPSRIIENKNAFDVHVNYKRFLVDGTTQMPSSWHTDHHSGDTIDKIEKGTQALYQFSSNSFLIITATISLIGSYGALAYFNIHATYIVVILTAITVYMITLFDRTLVRQYKELNRAENRVSEKVYDVISNITTVIILRIEKLVLQSIIQRMLTPFKLFMKNNKLNEVKWLLVSTASSLMVFFVIASYLGIAVYRGEVVLIGTVYILFGYVQKINNIFFRFANIYSDIVKERTAIANAEELSNEFKERRRVPQLSLDGNWEELKIENLSFSYHTKEGADLHLDDISLTIRRGEKIALLGESGSGKTTLLKVIRELYTPQHVTVLLDGVRLPYGFSSISESIALIPQDPEIFATTIRENITMGVNHPMDHVVRFSDMACFTDVANRLPRQFESSIVEKGVNLSGGEKQRLALARGFLASADKAMLLLDEPTSSVDVHNELVIFKKIFTAFPGKTVIASIHRLHLLSLFDTVVMFENGKIVARGPLAELRVSFQPLRELWSKYTQEQAKDSAKENA